MKKIEMRTGQSFLFYYLMLILSGENHLAAFPRSAYQLRSRIDFSNASFTSGSLKTALCEKMKIDDECLDGDQDEETNGAEEFIEREALQDLSVKRKKRNGSAYRTVDNRDNLPFIIKTLTPNPYRNINSPSEEKRKSQRNTRTKKGNNINSIAASVFAQNSDGTTGSVIGEFALDKSTTSGDIISIGDINYQVQVARCQYKYAGGKRFVMVRKILEVKEITRAGAELFLQHQFSKEMRKDDVPSIEL